jgi:hypothetical protein
MNIKYKIIVINYDILFFMKNNCDLAKFLFFKMKKRLSSFLIIMHILIFY